MEVVVDKMVVFLDVNLNAHTQIKQYSTVVHYKIPRYYVCQLLAEMYCLSADKLIYLLYTRIIDCFSR